MIMQIFEDIDIIGSKFHFYQGKTQTRKNSKKKNNIWRFFNNIYVGNMFHPYYTFW